MDALAVIAVIGGIALFAGLFNGITAQQLTIHALPVPIRLISSIVGILLISAVLYRVFSSSPTPTAQGIPTPIATPVQGQSASSSAQPSAIPEPTKFVQTPSEPTARPTEEPTRSTDTAVSLKPTTEPSATVGSLPPTPVPPTLPPPPSPLPITPVQYGVIGQGEQQTTLAPPGVCALDFYPFGGKEKTFVFSTEAGVWVQNYNGTLSCWPVTPSLDSDVGTDHPFATLDEVQKAGVVFSGDIIPVDPNTLPRG